ncbi:hypothetical protein PIB30_068546 [Stylosanthes scabra]|uniref:Uncharacterized protein n=1 Tax=Stylosanthes scabra TaxID=79078 RepID=A0ABU6YQL3_9FABA|nr:hypothetical protein [Stylosanthes scabra]
MARHSDTFDEVHPSKFDLKFYLYIVRLWAALARCNPKETQPIERVVEDSKGQRIHLQVPKGLAKQKKPQSSELLIPEKGCL